MTTDGLEPMYYGPGTSKRQTRAAIKRNIKKVRAMAKGVADDAVGLRQDPRFDKDDFKQELATRLESSAEELRKLLEVLYRYLSEVDAPSAKH